MLESTITSKGRITLPKPIREALSLKTGDRVRYVIDKGRVLILPVRPISWLSGALPYDGPPISLEEMNAAIREAARESASN